MNKHFLTIALISLFVSGVANADPCADKTAGTTLLALFFPIKNANFATIGPVAGTISRGGDVDNVPILSSTTLSVKGLCSDETTVLMNNAKLSWTFNSEIVNVNSGVVTPNSTQNACDRIGASYDNIPTFNTARICVINE